MITRVLVANRGEIARRVFATCRRLGLGTVAVYTEPDSHAPHVAEADARVRLPGTDGYLNIKALVDAAHAAGADAIHPGYGFLSENPEFAAAVQEAGLSWIGPPVAAVAAMGSKIEAKKMMAAAGVPVLEELDPDTVPESALPVLVKASAGGGGRGMRIVTELTALPTEVASARREAASAFGDDTVFCERYLPRGHHIEVQVLADEHGVVWAVGERECSIQRRHQKIMEETPSPAVTPEIRQRMGEAAVRAVQAAGYVNAGTVEFIFSEGDFYFLEVNARLQVEHPITEEVTGVDLVKEQIRVASGLPLSFSQEEVSWKGHAIEMRINAEDPARRFIPNPRRITRWVAPSGPGVRVDSGFGPGSDVPPNYDSLVAKLIVHGADRAEAIARARRALMEFVVVGPATTIAYHRAILESADFKAGRLTTRFIEDHPELIEQMQRFLGQKSPMDYGADARHVAAAAAAVAAVVGGSAAAGGPQR